MLLTCVAEYPGWGRFSSRSEGLSPVLAQEPAEILIRNGLIVTETGRLQADLRIRGGEIAEIGRNLTPARGARTVDATGKLVLPGGIDTHVHLTPVRTPDDRRGADDFESASRAALAGGITTIGAFIGQNPDVPAAQTLAEAAAAASRTTIADAILHFTVGDPTKLSPTDVALLRDRGVTLKIFMRGLCFEQRYAANIKLIEAAGRAGVLTELHAEDAAILADAQERLVAQGRTALVGQNFADSHPVAAEEVAAQRAVGFAEFTGAPIYLVHLSSERAMRVAEAARARGLPVFTEVRFIYLHLTRDAFNGPTALLSRARRRFATRPTATTCGRPSRAAAWTRSTPTMWATRAPRRWTQATASSAPARAATSCRTRCRSSTPRGCAGAGSASSGWSQSPPPIQPSSSGCTRGRG